MDRPCVAEPKWARVDYGPIDYQDLYYYSAPKRNVLASLALPYQRFACSLTTARA
jgi:hypothetical protein